jgi:hypothetical protein
MADTPELWMRCPNDGAFNHTTCRHCGVLGLWHHGIHHKVRVPDGAVEREAAFDWNQEYAESLGHPDSGVPEWGEAEAGSTWESIQNAYRNNAAVRLLAAVGGEGL